MAVQIILKNSSAEDKRPTAPQLANGEIALNYNAAGSFLTCKDTDGNIQQVGGVKISEVAPESPVKQTLWFQPSSLKLFVYDGDSYLPIAGGDGGGGTPGGGITTIVGDFGIDASTTGGVVNLDVDLAGGDDGLEFDTGRLKASIASDSQLGSVKIGDGIDVALDGTISVDIPQTLTFRGSVDLGQPPAGQINPDPPRTGDAYLASFGASPIDAGWTGIGGDVAVAGDLAVFDGTNWELINTGGTMQGVEGGAGIISSTSGGIATVAVDAGAGLEFDADDKLIVSGYPDLSGGDLDGRYLRKDAGTFDQTVLSTGTTTFDGIIEGNQGIKISGGDATTVGIGLVHDGDQLILESTDRVILSAKTSSFDINDGDFGNGATFTASFNLESTATESRLGCLSVRTRFSNDKAINAAYGIINESKLKGVLTSPLFVYYTARTPLGDPTPDIDKVIMYEASSSAQTSPQNIGFFSNLNISVGQENFSFFAENDAPNFFAGDTYIGGTTSRNTRELWESTLTDEQKEQLAAGTLVVPANVSLPGDGSFARQWWYDQQDEETQALIDAGELDYPEPFAAATFTNTFALGDSTNINLLATGAAYFKGGITGGGTNGAAPEWTIAADGTATGITVTRAAVVTDEQAGTVETLLDIITDLRARVEALEAAATS